MLTLLVAVLSCVGLLAFSCRKKPKMPTVPGPPAWPIVGNLPQMTSDSPHMQWADWSKEYGPIFKLWIGRKESLVLNDYDSIYEAYVKQGKTFAGRPNSFRRWMVWRDGGGIMNGQFDEGLKVKRKAVHASLKSLGACRKVLEGFLQDAINEMINNLKASEGKVFDPRLEIYSTALRTVSILTFGGQFSRESSHFKEIKSLEVLTGKALTLSFSGNALDIIPWLKYFGNNAYKDVVKVSNIHKSFWSNFYKGDRKDNTLSEDTSKDGLGGTVVEMLRGSSHLVSDEDVKSVSYQMIYAGVITTAYTLYALFLTLLHHPHIERKLRKEIFTTIGTRQVSFDDKENLPYTMATLYEILRISNIAVLAIPHRVVEDTKLFEHFIPKDTTVYINLWALLHDERYWPEPYAFKPERFLDDQGNLLPADHPNRQRLMPFGAGPRVCVGEAFAMVRLFLWIVTVFQNFKLAPDGENPTTPFDPRTYIEDNPRPRNYKMRFISLTDSEKQALADKQNG